ncbi:hypothetical protein M422DRAFT_253405 [Sphaerobolus stellatus SS14]|uniref:DUF659 domain-containing protein n=1 Tax=Sphaerobolus stellatus (strain SS14) TaxID=990650 RepID=A0A0C9VXP2_SPHS4|nr:hypothetical protein M422DRAFT_253405 [Sphaerobolus stellatus SS14]
MTMEDSMIPAEASVFFDKKIEALKELYHLSLSFDDGSLRSAQAMETIHVTTPDWDIHFIGAQEATEESQTANNRSLQVLNIIGVEHFSAISSDGAGNARKPRDMLSEKYPMIFSFYDATHATQLPCHDASKMDCFIGTVKDMCAILSYFKHSKKSSALLQTILQKMNISRGLLSIGKTCFATYYWAALAVMKWSELLAATRMSGGKLLTKSNEDSDNDEDDLEDELGALGDIDEHIIGETGRFKVVDKVDLSAELFQSLLSEKVIAAVDDETKVINGKKRAGKDKDTPVEEE